MNTTNERKVGKPMCSTYEPIKQRILLLQRQGKVAVISSYSIARNVHDPMCPQHWCVAFVSLYMPPLTENDTLVFALQLSYRSNTAHRIRRCSQDQNGGYGTDAGRYGFSAQEDRSRWTEQIAREQGTTGSFPDELPPVGSI